MLLIILILVTNGVWGVLQKARESKIKLDVAREEYKTFKSRHDNLASQVSFLETEAGIEKEIRTKYNFAKQDEKAIIIVDNDEEDELTEEEKPRGIFGTIKSWFTD